MRLATGCAQIWIDAGEIDHMTDGTLRQILTHNETWKKKCNGDKIPAGKD